ncbi:MAG: pentapeptide repeat-containing protein [Anaerolineales bacterium]|nr:pentapeptide repeat-containing protein [Anaerolineales bacterium]
MAASLASSEYFADRDFNAIHLERGRINSTEFFDCGFIRCNFTESVFHNCRFSNCVFLDCNLGVIKVPGSIFSLTKFENSKVIGVNWTEADWTTALANPIGFYKSTINHCTFIGLELKGIQIKDCIATEVDFREADLSQADFTGTDLAQSLFVNTDLTEADLSRARNYNIDPGENILKQTKFSLPEAMSLLDNLDIILVDGT